MNKNNCINIKKGHKGLSEDAVNMLWWMMHSSGVEQVCLNEDDLFQYQGISDNVIIERGNEKYLDKLLKDTIINDVSNNRTVNKYSKRISINEFKILQEIVIENINNIFFISRDDLTIWLYENK